MMCIVEASGNLWRLHSHVDHNQHQKQDDQDEDDFYDDDSDISEDMEMIIIRITDLWKPRRLQSGGLRTIHRPPLRGG